MWAKDPAVGGLATLALLGLAYALSQIEALPLFPLDVAQAGIRPTPEPLATEGIDALSPGAEMPAEAVGLVVVVLTGAVAGGAVTHWNVQRPWLSILPLVAVAIALVAAVQTLAGTLPIAPGDRVVVVRATDGDGAIQSAESLPPHSSGASGWHTLRLRVDE
jgi:hypothetical protein